MIERRSLLAASAAGLLLARGASAAATPFRIGALNPVTGAGSPYGPGMQKMILAAAEEVNAAGGAAGRRFEVSAEDTQTQPQAAVLAAKKLIEVNRVNAMLGVWSSGESLAVMPLTNDANMLMMNCSGAPALSVPPANAKGYGYRFQATNDRFGRAFAEICAREGYKRPATMAFNNASGIGNTEGFARAWKAKGNTVVASVVYEPNQSSYRAELQRVLAAKPDVIVTGSYLADTTIILREWFQSGADNKWVIPGWAANPELVQALGPQVTEGIFSVESVSNEGAASFTRFDAAYRKAAGQSGLGNAYAAMAWDMVIVLALAIEAAGPEADTAAINAKMREVANPAGTKVYSFIEGRDALKSGKINYEGASSVLDFDQYGDVTPDFGASVISGGKIERRYVVSI
jgi:branched-chain amino acid transport system substrate-binding protein